MKPLVSLGSVRAANGSDIAVGVEGMESRGRSGSRTILDIRDLAEIFKCSTEKIKRMARCGNLPAFKFGKHWYVRQEDLERFLKNQVESGSHLRRDQENRE
jgi:excisionase family DNA binding protein